MDTQTAFRILELLPSSSPDEIDLAYRRLARHRHPDAGGSEAAMAELNEAREVALTSKSRTTALVTLETIRDIVVASNQELAQRQELRAETAQIVERLKERATNRLRRYKDLSALFGGISAAALFLGKDLPAQYIRSLPLDERMAGIMSFMALSIAIYAGVTFWFLSDRIRRTEAGIEELKQALSIRSRYVNFLASLVPHDEPWTLAQLERSIEAWDGSEEVRWQSWRSIAQIVGATAFAELLIAKGRELQLLQTSETILDGEFLERYSLRLPVST